MAVFEQQGRYRPTSVQGQHVFLVALTNQSEEAITIGMISLSSESNQIEIYEGNQAVNEVLEPNETRDFTMFVNVSAMRGSYIYTIESLEVTVTCASPTRGNFTESSSQRVTPVD